MSALQAQRTYQQQRKADGRAVSHKKDAAIYRSGRVGLAAGLAAPLGVIAVGRGVNAARGARWARQTEHMGFSAASRAKRRRAATKMGARIPNQRTELAAVLAMPITTTVGQGSMQNREIRRQYPGYKRHPLGGLKEVHKAFTPILSNAGKGLSLSPATRALRIGQTKAAGARGMFGGAASQQFNSGGIAAHAAGRHRGPSMNRAKGEARFGGSSSQQFNSGGVASRTAGRHRGPSVNRAKGEARFGGSASRQFPAIGGQTAAPAPRAGASRFSQTQGGGSVPRGAGASAHGAASGMRGGQRGPSTYRQAYDRGQVAGQKAGGFVVQHKKPIAIGGGVGLAAVGGGAAMNHHRVKKDMSMSVSVWGVDHGYDPISKSNWPGSNNTQRDKNVAANAAVMGALPGFAIPAGGIYAGSKARKGRGLSVGARVTGRQVLESGVGGLIGAKIGGSRGATIGSLGGSSHAAWAATRNAGKRGDLNKR